MGWKRIPCWIWCRMNHPSSRDWRLWRLRIAQCPKHPWRRRRADREWKEARRCRHPAGASWYSGKIRALHTTKQWNEQMKRKRRSNCFFPLTFDLGRSVAAVRATQPVFRLLLQELLANRLGLFGKFGWVRLLRLTNPSIHFFPLDFLFACSKRSLAFDHFVD